MRFLLWSDIDSEGQIICTYEVTFTSSFFNMNKRCRQKLACVLWYYTMAPLASRIIYNTCLKLFPFKFRYVQVSVTDNACKYIK